MGKVTIRDSVEKVGDSTTSTVEYIFESYPDFLDWQDRKNKSLTDAMIDMYKGLSLKEEGNEQEQSEQSAVVDIDVKKKVTKH